MARKAAINVNNTGNLQRVDRPKNRTIPQKRGGLLLPRPASCRARPSYQQSLYAVVCIGVSAP